ncbi:MAG: hypothetical protein JWN44_6078 [Myxococcales bacterium]|nr:hypothetical protein [Myxococcales bacterium]
MSIRNAISAFAHRGARRGTAATFLLYSALLTTALLLLAAWIAPEARAADVETLGYWLRSSPKYEPALDPSLWTTLALADVFACFTLGLAGFVLAPAMVAAAVANERRAGTLDQLRTTPMSPLGLACGLVVGVPARLYLLCAGPALLHVVAAFATPLPMASCLQSLVVIVVGTAASCVIGLCVALAPRQESGGTFAALGVAALLGLAAFLAGAFAGDRHMVAWSYLHPAGALDAVMLAQKGLWRRMVVGAWGGGSLESYRYVGTLALVPFASVAASLVFGVVSLRAACRKLESPQLPLFSKPQAVTLFVLAAAAMVTPMWGARTDVDIDGTAVYALSMFMLPVLVVVGLFSTPTFEAWAVAVRRGQRLGWSADDASAHRAVWMMEGLWSAFLFVLLSRHWMHSMNGDETLALVWAAALAMSLPVYFLFASTKYSTVAARWAFGVAVGAHLLCQVIALAIVRGHEVRGFSGTFVTLAAIAGVAVPVWTAWRQRVLRVRTLAR